MTVDIRDLILAEVKANPGITSREIAAKYPAIRYKRISSVLSRMVKKTKEIYFRGSSVNRRYYPFVEEERLQ